MVKKSNKKSTTTTTVVRRSSNRPRQLPLSQQPPNYVRYSRRRRNNRRRQALPQGMVMAKRNYPGRSRNPYLASLNIESATLYRDTQRLIDTMFIGTNGRSRGPALGMEPSALLSAKGFFDYTVPAGGNSNLVICPMQPQYNGFIQQQVNTALGAAPGTNPWLTGTGTTQVASGGPFGPVQPNPTNAYRCVGFHVQITPTNSVTTTGGITNIVHIPALYSLLQPQASSYTGPGTQLELENQMMQQTFAGDQTVRYNWCGGPNEILEFTENLNTTPGPFSGLYVSNVNQTGNQLGYRLEYIADYEILPNASVYYWDKAMPTMSPQAYEHVARFVRNHWKPAMIGTLKEWQIFANCFNERNIHETSAQYSLASMVAPVSRDKVHTIMEEEKYSNIAGYDDAYYQPEVSLGRRGEYKGWINY